MTPKGKTYPPDGTRAVDVMRALRILDKDTLEVELRHAYGCALRPQGIALGYALDLLAVQDARSFAESTGELDLLDYLSVYHVDAVWYMRLVSREIQRREA